MIKGDILKIPDELLKKFQTNKIDEILITGMGTCYTAAVAIGANMSNHPVIKQSKILVRPYLASELSAFYIRENMENTVLIAIAQSGTTIDTNVAVKMVKEKGAYTLAILNKRGGDISYLVDTTLYLGNGRDIEIAVPSTKTYICHILVGTILTYFISEVINKNKNSSIKKLVDLPLQISETIENYHSIKLEKCLKKFIEYTHWYVVYDSPNNFIAGMEARIKLSECCYQSIPLLSIDEFIESNINNSIVIFLADSTKGTIQNFLNKVEKNNNYIVLIGNDILLNQVKLPNNSITKIKYQHYSDSAYSAIIPTIINCQLLSYNVALTLDYRQNYFLRIVNDMDSKKNYRKSLKGLLSSIERNNMQVRGLPIEKLDNTKYLINELLIAPDNNTFSKIKDNLYYLARYAMRPIDTIKHQAKTITVGTQRLKKITKGSNNYSIIENKLSINNKEFSEKRSKGNRPTAYLVGENINDTLIKFMVNFLYCSGKYFDDIPAFYSLPLYENADKIREITYTIKQQKQNSNASGIFFELNNTLLGENNEFEGLKNELENEINDHGNKQISMLLNSLFASLYIIRKLSKKTDKNKINRYINELVKQIKLVGKFSINTNHIKRVDNISQMIRNAKNVKFLGSGENYDAAKFLSLLAMKKFGKPCAVDVLENHKHIDMSAEPLIINLISNILDESYQNDAYAEIEKANSHNNIPIIITNSFDNRFDDPNFTTIKIPCVYREISLLTYVILFKNFLF